MLGLWRPPLQSRFSIDAHSPVYRSGASQSIQQARRHHSDHLPAHPRLQRSGRFHLASRRGRCACRSTGAGRSRRQRTAAFRRSGRGQGQCGRRRPFDHRGLSGICLHAEQGRHCRRPAARGRGHHHRQNQSRPVCNRVGRHAVALWNSTQHARSKNSFLAVQVRARRSRLRRGWSRSRLGQTPPARDACPQCSTTSSG